MKLSVEAKVAAAVAAGFMALTLAAIGERGAEAQSVGPNKYEQIDSPRVSTQMIERVYKSFPPDQTSAKVQEETLSGHDLTSTTAKNGTKDKTGDHEGITQSGKLSGTDNS